MKTTMRHALRFFSFWLLMLITIRALTIVVLAVAFISYSDAAILSWGVTVATPIIGFLFAWLFFRNIDGVKMSGILELAAVWSVLYAVSGMILNPLMYGLSWYIEFTDPEPIILLILIFVGFVLAGHLKQKKSPGLEVNLLDVETVISSEKIDMPSEHSPEA